MEMRKVVQEMHEEAAEPEGTRETSVDSRGRKEGNMPGASSQGTFLIHTVCGSRWHGPG